MSAEVSPDFSPARRVGVTSVELDGETVVYADGAIHKLDRIATLLWNTFDGTTTIASIAHDLAAVYDEPYDRVLEDVMRYVGALREQGLVSGSTTGQPT